MKKADQAASERPPPGHNMASHAAMSFDPIMTEVVKACNKHWTELLYVPGKTKADLDDDKQGYCSLKWPEYGV